MLQVRDITKWFGDLRVLDHISFNLNRGERAGLIGPNGCGKTTLLRILTGQAAADRGTVTLSPASLRVGYLPQAPEFPPGSTVGDVLAAAQGQREAAETRLEQLAEAVAAAAGPDLPDALAQYDRALADYQALGGEAARAGADVVLAGLGLGDVTQERPVTALSGGQKTRLGLARLLLQQPDLLLLDEPTNHLDIAALDWLEGYLGTYPGAVLIVSHDRAFLDRTVTTILLLDDKTHALTAYAGNYTAYAEAVDRARDRQWAMYREQQTRISDLQSSIRALSGQAKGIEQETIHFYFRRIAKDLARRAVVQKRRLERMLADEDMVEKPGLTWKMKLEFADAPRSGQEVLQVSDLSVGYGERALLHDCSVRLTYGERAVLLGPNGAGKTTLLRCILGELPPWSGVVRLGRGVRAGYMPQEDDRLDPKATPFDLVRAAAPLDETEARSFLHYFLFAGDEVFVPVGTLSLGQRKRLLLALLAVAGCNFLLLDEPVNHLDIPSRENFEAAIVRFRGTVLAVVHDRYFVEQVASALWVLEDGQIKVIDAGGEDGTPNP
ncbi:MAG TPA: ABC-F family ATP-binding cassette domain-containing protein [Anaerolineae bacterium]